MNQLRFIATVLCAACCVAAHACDTAQQRAFDFFVGNWVAYDAHDHSRAGTNLVTKELDGCVIFERYANAADPLRGWSMSAYDQRRNVWHQTWMTNGGNVLLLDGRVVGNSITFEGTDRGSNGHARMNRVTWTPLPNGTVEERNMISTDAGKTWREGFDLIFKRVSS